MQTNPEDVHKESSTNNILVQELQRKDKQSIGKIWSKLDKTKTSWNRKFYLVFNKWSRV